MTLTSLSETIIYVNLQPSLSALGFSLCIATPCQSVASQLLQTQDKNRNKILLRILWMAKDSNMIVEP